MRKEQKSKIESFLNAQISPSSSRVNSKKSLFKNEDDLLLLSIIEQLCELEVYISGALSVGISLFELEEKWITLIQTLLIKSYGEETTQIIMWWVYNSITPDDEVLPIVIELEGEKKEILVKTPSQLVRFLKKYIIS